MLPAVLNAEAEGMASASGSAMETVLEGEDGGIEEKSDGGGVGASWNRREGLTELLSKSRRYSAQSAAVAAQLAARKRVSIVELRGEGLRPLSIPHKEMRELPTTGSMATLQAATAFAQSHHRHQHRPLLERAKSLCGCGQSESLHITNKKKKRACCSAATFFAFFGSIPPGYTLRQRVHIILSGTPAGWCWDLFQTLLTIIACTLYVTSTYDIETSLSVDTVISVLFSIDYLLRWYASEQRVVYPFTFHALVDFFTIVPVYIEVFSTDGVPQLAFLRFVRVLRVMRVLRAFKILNSAMTAVQRQLISLVLTIVSIMFLSAGLIHVVETELSSDNKSLTFGDSVYFIVVTMSTVGYGDISADTALGKVIVSIMIMASFVLIPMQVNQLTFLLSQQSRYHRRIAIGDVPHALLVGHVSNKTALTEFVMEFMHPDRMGPVDSTFKKRQLVILSPQEPPDYIKRLMSNPVLEGKLRYYAGSVMHDDDLFGAAADAADACFVLGNPDASDREREDKHTILRTLAVMNFNPSLQTHVHLLDVRHRPLIKQAQVTSVISVNELKMRLIAQSCIALGFSTLLNNLLRSVSGSRVRPEPWLKEYKYGCALELYTTTLPSECTGKPFITVARAIYDRFHGEAICWGVLHPKQRSQPDILMNPGASYVMADADRVFVAAADMQVTARVSSPGYASFFTEASVVRGTVPEVQRLERPLGLAASVAERTPFGPRTKRCKVSELEERLVSDVPFEDHIVVGGDLTDVEILLTALRTRTLAAMDMIKRIILIVNGDLSKYDFLPLYEEVYLLEGDASHVNTLQRCNLSRARCCVLLPSRTDVDNVDGDILDTNVIFSYLVVEKYLQDHPVEGFEPYVVSNVSSVSNMRVLDSSIRARTLQQQSTSKSHWDRVRRSIMRATPQSDIPTPDAPGQYQRRSSYAFGMTSLAEQIRSRLRVEQQQRRKELSKQRRKENAELFARGGDSGVNLPFYASGQCFATNTLHTWLCQSFYDSDTFLFAEALLNPSVHTSILLPYDVPKSIHNEEFGSLFRALLERNIICVALYRGATPHHSGYVFAGPSPSTKVYAGDKLFVLQMPDSQRLGVTQMPSFVAPSVASRSFRQRGRSLAHMSRAIASSRRARRRSSLEVASGPGSVDASAASSATAPAGNRMLSPTAERDGVTTAADGSDGIDTDEVRPVRSVDDLGLDAASGTSVQSSPPSPSNVTLEVSDTEA